MSASVKWDGLAQLREDLRRMPADLTADATVIMNRRVDAAESAIKAGYPDRTGDLKDHVKRVVNNAGQFGVRITLTNTSKLAFIFEHGTMARHTALGANRGIMPAGNVFVPPIVKERTLMYEELKALLEKTGARVSGEP